ncbi:MAG: WecB/TagA/CpsF family glycosyltransferase [Rhizobiaceae bacterium]|nr:WecB/TagA/CpsF family glycosyltransferase [Rhizobiaceae bacterium]MCV0406073.1 WecB/TagA/CpsF family glycosyltransferase [Rhizobiaceae bacterium]
MTIHSRPAPILPEMNILGTRVTAISWGDALALLSGALADRRHTRVSFLNAHNANIAQIDDRFAEAMDDFLVLPDGIGVDIAAKILYGRPFPDNLNGTDFVPDFFRTCEAKLRVGLIGARRDNAEAAAAALGRLAPQHEFVFIHDGYFAPREEPAILARIEAERLDVLLVAMGVPRQELWIADRIGPGHCTMPIAVGALLDFMSGAVPRAPLWMRRLRLEWVYRLLQEPTRLWRRYVVGNPLFLARVIGQKLGWRRARR